MILMKTKTHLVILMSGKNTLHPQVKNLQGKLIPLILFLKAHGILQGLQVLATKK